MRKSDICDHNTTPRTFVWVPPEANDPYSIDAITKHAVVAGGGGGGSYASSSYTGNNGRSSEDASGGTSSHGNGGRRGYGGDVGGSTNRGSGGVSKPCSPPVFRNMLHVQGDRGHINREECLLHCSSPATEVAVEHSQARRPPPHPSISYGYAHLACRVILLPFLFI